MSIKDFHYQEIDGDHFPDATLGSNLYYGLDFTCWLGNEEDVITGVEWNIPEGIDSMPSFITGNVGNIKLKPLRTGSFIINCVMTSEETLNTVTLRQEKSIDTMLKVF
jgi:hypothetical protein